MRFVDFRTFPAWTNIAIFAGAAVLVWMAGTRLANYADAIAARTKLSKAFLGLILLGVATSLPQIRGGPILAARDRPALCAGTIGIVVTCIYLVGLLDRRDRTVLRMGDDSLGVLGAYVIGVVGLYFLG